MSVNLERKPFSVPEVLGGGMALAAVALIAGGSLRVAPPQNSSPAPSNYASVSIQSSEALVRSSFEQPAGLSDIAATRDVQSADARLGSDHPTSTDSNDTKAPPTPAADRPAAAAAGETVGLRFQQRGAEADSPEVLTAVVWGPPLSSRLSGFQLANHRQRHAPAPSTESGFIGNWTDGIGRCRTGRKAPLVINSRAAKTANGECAFGFVAREAANRWRVSALCTAGGNFWRANIALKLVEPNLTWSSERGIETYVRCRR
jgi:hypothetical protein